MMGGCADVRLQPEALRRAPDAGFYDTGVAAKLVEYLFSVRNALDPGRGLPLRSVAVMLKLKPLMRDRGFRCHPEQ